MKWLWFISDEMQAHLKQRGLHFDFYLSLKSQWSQFDSMAYVLWGESVDI